MGRNDGPRGFLIADPRTTAVKGERKIWKIRPGLGIAPSLSGDGDWIELGVELTVSQVDRNRNSG